MPGGKRSGASGAAQGNTKRNRSGSSENDDQSKTPPINNQTEDSSTTSDAPDQGLPRPPANTPGAYEGPIGSYPGSILPSCINCGGQQLATGTWMILGACNHLVCAACGFELLSARGCNLYATCPAKREQCDLGHNAHSYYYWTSTVEEESGTSTRTASSAESSDQERVLKGPNRVASPETIEKNKHKDGYRYYSMQSDEWKQSTMMLSSAYPMPDGRTQAQSTFLPLQKTIQLDEHQIHVVNNTMVMLHTPVMNHDRVQWLKASTERMEAQIQPTVAALNNDGLNCTDLLPEVLHSLALGEPRAEARQRAAEDPRHQTTCFMAYAAAQILRIALGSTPTLFHEVISQAAIIIGLPVAFYYLLKKYSIVSNRDAVNLKNAKAVEERIMKGWNMIDWIWGECVFVYDNIGFKCRGTKVGYHQFTHIQVIMVPYGFLKKFGVYCNNKVSRVRKVWKDIRSRCSPATLLPTEEDYNLFHERFLGTIGDILAVYDTFPDSEECEMMIEKWKESKKTLFDSGGVTVPAEFGERQLTNADRSISGNCDSEVEIVETVMPEGGATNAILTELEVDEDEVGDDDNRRVRTKTQHSPSNLDVTLERTEQQLSAQLLTLQGAKDGSTRAVKRKMEEREEREQTTPLGNPLNLPCEPFALPSMVTATANDKDPDTFGDGIIRPPGNKLYRAQLPSEYRSPVLQDDPLSTHDWMFKNHGKSLKKQRTELLPRSDTIKFDVGKDKDELLRNLQLSGCPDALHETVHKLVTEDWDVFAESGLRNSIRGFSFQVDTGDAKPIDCGAPRYGPNESPIIVKLVDTLENNGLVEDNTGPWGALIVLAAKPHQGLKRWEEFQWRLCVSYRKLNQVTKPFRYPIPRCDDAVEDIDALARWFISVDMDSGYWQIPADPETREKLAFYTPNGKKHWTVTRDRRTADPSRADPR